MKPTNLLLNCWLICLLTGGGAAAAEAPAQPPLFPDKKLEAAVRKYVFEKRDTDKPIVEADVINISTIEGKRPGHYQFDGTGEVPEPGFARSGEEQNSRPEALAGIWHGSSTWTWRRTRWKTSAPLAKVIALQYVELSHNRVSNIEAAPRADQPRLLVPVR